MNKIKPDIYINYLHIVEVWPFVPVAKDLKALIKGFTKASWGTLEPNLGQDTPLGGHLLFGPLPTIDQ